MAAHERDRRVRPEGGAAIRFRVPDGRAVEFDDRIHGPQRFRRGDLEKLHHLWGQGYPFRRGPAEERVHRDADGAGNVAQVTTTIESPFGSGLSVDGVMLNNELTDFDIVPEKQGYLVANRVEGGKRPRSSMAPTIVYGPDGKVRLAVGAAGGSTIIAQVAKAIIGVVDWKLSAQDAIALGLVYAPGPVAMIEKGTEREAMIPALQALGEKVQAAPLGLKANAIEYVRGNWAGGADPRSEGVVMHQDGRVPAITRFGAVPSRPSE